MKKIVFTFLNIVAFAVHTQAQCTFKELFPVEHGCSKFKSTTTIASIKNIKENKQANQLSFLNRWDKFDYLKNDSVHKAVVFYDYIYHPCYNGDENELVLSFVDNKLYKIMITLTYSNTKFENCIEKYNTLVSTFKKPLPFWTEFVQTNRETKEQTGEGYWLYPISVDQRDTVKIEYLSIGYEIKYGKKYSEHRKEFYQTGNVENYVIEIEYVNLKGTKLTNKGY